ncbi:bifunctional Actin family/ATPase [Babesia duncani]|uniref:Bifunctional Actin family/ATPase n=1 Tax=Babesia duncani TaxID=323732 RepID=A0AAD9UQB8_9APIC|nr:bifunctional Actin family/ATPase [Babesia duncani]
MAAKAFSGGDDVAAVVVDPGYDTLRIGNCQEDYPREYIPSALVRRVWSSNEERSWKPLCAINPGDFVETKRLLQLNRDENYEIEPTVFEKLLKFGIEGYPYEVNHVPNPELWAKKYGGLGLDITQHPMMISEPTSETKQYRDVILEVIFERCNVPASYLAKRASLSAFAVGRASALVLDVGAGGCICSAVHDGIALQSSIESAMVGGYALDLHLANALHDEGVSYFEPGGTPLQEFKRLQMARELKETFSSLEPGNDDESKTYKLPDGTLVDMQKHGASLPRLLFNPEGAKVCEFNNFKGLGAMVTNCVFETDVDIRRDVLSSIVIVGGTSLVPGFVETLHASLQDTLLGPTKFKLVHPSSVVEKRYSTWLGGSILASLGRFQQMWISRAEYLEHGTTIAYRRCQ